MHLVSNGFVASNFTEETANMKGTKTRSHRVKTTNTLDREKAVAKIYELAQREKKSVDTKVTQILQDANNELRQYVIAKGEIPDGNKYILGIQAALLRADEIATIAVAVDTTDSDALEQIESAENEAREINSADASPLSPLTQGALTLLLNHVRIGLKNKGGKGTLAEVVNSARRIQPQSQSNGFNGDVSYNNASGMVWNFSPEVLSGAEQASTTAAANTSAPKTDVWGSIFSIFDKVVTGIQTVGTTIGNVSGTVKDTAGSISGVASDIGSDSITKSLKANAPYIIGGIILLAVLIFIAVYAAKRK